jgi:hypothetical protein
MPVCFCLLIFARNDLIYFLSLLDVAFICVTSVPTCISSLTQPDTTKVGDNSNAGSGGGLLEQRRRPIVKRSLSEPSFVPGRWSYNLTLA